MPTDRSTRFVAWLRARAVPMVVAWVLIVGLAGYLIAFHLPLRADFSYLLPQDTAAVKDLRRLQARAKNQDSALVIVVAPDATRRAAAAEALIAQLRTLPPSLVTRLETDDALTRTFIGARRHLFVPLPDLIAVRDALARTIDAKKLAANPLFVDLDDEPDAATEAAAKADRQQLDNLRARQRDAETALAKSSNVSADGTTQLIVVKTAFPQSDIARGTDLLARIAVMIKTVEAAHPGVRAGPAGGPVISVAEHTALVRGMAWSSIATAILVCAVLLWYLRSTTLLVMLSGNLAVAVIASFGLAAITVGHLNAATAFLGAIIAGNGVNYGILLVARYLRERRDHDVDIALARAIRGSLVPTIIASLGAAIAYGSLAATSFRGFADFAWIGAVGMGVCWIATFTLLPALIVRWGRGARVYRGEPRIGALLARAFGFRRPSWVLAAALATTVLCGWIAVRYLRDEPLEYNMKNLRSKGAEAVTARSWMDISDRAFGRGIAGRTYVLADRPDQVPEIVAALRAIDATTPAEAKTIGQISSIQDVMPPDQAARLEVLREVRALLSDEIQAELKADGYADLAALVPPADLALITAADLPAEVVDRLAERDGTLGNIVAVRPALTLDEYDGRDLTRFANAVRKVELASGETVSTSGAAVIFADIMAAIRRDGPIVTAVALAGLALMVLGLVGPNRRGFAVLASTALGTLAMIAVCALIGLKVNFLDFVALPITLGLGVDYAINIAYDAHEDPLEALRDNGSAVFLCSLTTIIGYGSLLISDNLAIRGFGLASLIGEVTCLFTALAFVPSLVSWRGAQRRGPSHPSLAA